MQEVRHFKPSTVSQRLSVAAGFCKTCVIDGLLERSPADHVRRPSVPPESPTFPLRVARLAEVRMHRWW
jgi:site-specific recombinase XerC